MSRSYDSSKEDAQNPFPTPPSTPPGKAAFQSGKAGKRPIPRSESLDTTIYTPPPKTKSFDEATSVTKGVNHALRRPQTVDMQSTPDRAKQAKQIKRVLQSEFDAAREEQQATTKDEQRSASLPGTSSNKSPQAAAKAKCNSKAAGKAKAKAEAKTSPSKAKADPPSSSKHSRKDKEDDGDSMKDHATARGSKDEMPGKRPRTPSKKASNESLPEAKIQKTSTPSPAKLHKPEAAATADGEDGKLSEKLLAKKREAHKLYMRFHRSINGGSPSFTYHTS